MPTHKEHRKYCRKRGISSEACDFVNKLIDFPEEILPEVLKTKGLKSYLGERLGRICEELIYAIYLNLEKPPSHGAVHGVWKGDCELTQAYRKMLEEIAGYFYGEEGREAVRLHLELDLPEHIEHELSLYLLEDVKGSQYIPHERRYLPIVGLLRRAIGKKDIEEIIRYIKRYGKIEKIKEIMNKQSCVVPGKTFGQLIEEIEELRWLKPLKDLV